MIPEQSRAARAFLNWSIRQLAAEVGLSPNTVLAFENGRIVHRTTPEKIFAGLTKAGIRFSSNEGWYAVHHVPRNVSYG